MESLKIKYQYHSQTKIETGAWHFRGREGCGFDKEDNLRKQATKGGLHCTQIGKFSILQKNGEGTLRKKKTIPFAV